MATDPREIVISEMRKQTALLHSIDATLTLLASATASMLEAWRKVGPAADSPPVNNRILDGPHGDPEVRQKDPRDWAGDSMKGRRFSECPPEYLDLLADRYDYFAGRETDEKKAGYNRLDAARARGWAARLRGGWTAPVQPQRVDETQGEPTW